MASSALAGDADFAAERRQHRRPLEGSTAHLPDVLMQGLNEVEAILSQCSEAPPALSVLFRDLRSAASADVHLKKLSQLPALLQEVAASVESQELRATILHAIARCVVFPWLLDCRMRYAHKVLIGIARNYFYDSDHYKTLLGELFRQRILHASAPCVQACRLATSGATSTTNSVSHHRDALAPLRDDVVHFMNCVDSVTVTLVPVYRDVFFAYFAESLPLLGESVNWALQSALTNAAAISSASVAAPLKRGRSPERENDPGNQEPHVGGGSDRACQGTRVFGEDVDLLRFFVRVTATHVHKFMQHPGCVSLALSPAHCKDGLDGWTAILCSASRMLSTPMLPKDVLNAAGLLVASILTLRSLSLPVIRAACESSCAQVLSAGYRSHEWWTTNSRAAIDVLVSGERNSDALTPLRSLCSPFTNIGRFAFFKGLLSHCQAPIHGDVSSLCLLLLSDGDGSADSPNIVHDVIATNAITFTSEVQEPDVRFMAIQTLDHVVRHIAGVLKEIASEASRGALDPELKASFTRVCQISNKLRATVQSTVAMIMALWDDPTQQVSGPLYDTYRIVLSINDGIATCRAALGMETQPSSADECTVHGSYVLSPVDALQQVLQTQNDRRGKYHALLALVDVLPLEALLAHVPRPSHADEADKEEDDAAVARQLVAFCAPLIAGACNSKISSVCGEVLAAMAKKVMDRWGTEEATSMTFVPTQHARLSRMWRMALLDPIVLAAAAGAASFRGLNVSTTQAVSNVVAHMMTPLLKRWPSITLNVALDCIVERRNEAFLDHSGAASSSVQDPSARCWTQVAIETLYRARTCFIDTSSLVEPTNTSIFPLVVEALQTYDYELRMTAFGIAALSLKGSEPVAQWQCTLVERFLLLNLHQGGDSTARGALLQNIHKWVRRLCDSLTSSKTRTGVPADPKKQKQLRRTGGTAPPTDEQLQQQEQLYQRYVHNVYDHIGRLVTLLSAHSGALQPTADALSLERRFAAMSAYAMVVESILPIIAGDAHPHVAAALQRHSSIAPDPSRRCVLVKAMLLPSSMIGALLATVSEGWDKIRVVAETLLNVYVTENPSAVAEFLSAEVSVVTSPHFADLLFTRSHDEAITSTAAFSVVKQLQSARFKDCEGAVRKIILAIRLQKIPRETTAAHLDTLLARIALRCRELGEMKTMEVYRGIQARPLHGPLSLCHALFALLLGGQPEQVARLVGGANGGRRTAQRTPLDVADTAVNAATEAVLDVCREMLIICSTLVSSSSDEEPALATADGANNASDGSSRIDCRGHVYHIQSSSEESAQHVADTEALSRIVVNNSWLGIRAATSCVEWVVQHAPASAFSPTSMATTVSILVETLLRTKHNGVMSKSRQTLKAMCTALLRSKQPEYYAIPAEALSSLLSEAGVTSEDEGRVLRRSQGLPHAILPMLEAEDPTVPFVMFPLAMDRLFSVMGGSVVASGGSNLAVSHRVNALNVLKFIFDDRILGGRVVPYIQDAFVGAASGFRHSHWAVRNSSLMLFSSVLHRFIGDHPSTGGGGANTSFHDVASRIPRGMVFVLEELESAVAETERTNFVQPALFPVLLMLSMLTPDSSHLTTHVAGIFAPPTTSDHNDEPGNNGVAARFADDNTRAMQLVQRCRSIRNLMARGASAGALCGLVSVEKLPSTIHELGQEMKRVGLAANQAGRNALHGALLHIQKLFGHYVGTVHVDAPIRPSSRFHPTLARSVLAATLRVLSMAREELVEASQCPTVADVYLRVACDALYFSAVHGITGDECIELSLLRSTIACALTVSRRLCEFSQNTHSNADVVASKCRVGLFIALIGSCGRSTVTDDLAEEQVAAIVRTEAKRLAHQQTLFNRWNSLLWIGDALAHRCGEAIIGVTPNRYHRDLFTCQDASATIAWLDNLITMPLLRPFESVVLDPASFPETIAASSFVTPRPMSMLFLSTATYILDAHNSHESKSAVGKWSIAAFENLTSILQFTLTFQSWSTSSVLVPTSSASNLLGEGLHVLVALLYRVLDTVPYSAAKSLSVQCLAQLQHGGATTPTPELQRGGAMTKTSSKFVDVVRACASSEMPAVARHSAVMAVEQCMISGNPQELQVAASSVLLLSTHFRLLFDDEEGVRRHACEAATRVALRLRADPSLGNLPSAQGIRHPPPVVNTSAPSSYCQVTCAFLLTSLLRAFLHHRVGDDHAALAAQVTSILLENCDGGGVPTADDVGGDVGGPEEEEDVLFEREAANMFEEAFTMQQWCTLITSKEKGKPQHATLLLEVLADQDPTGLFVL